MGGMELAEVGEQRAERLNVLDEFGGELAHTNRSRIVVVGLAIEVRQRCSVLREFSLDAGSLNPFTLGGHIYGGGVRHRGLSCSASLLVGSLFVCQRRRVAHVWIDYANKY